MEEFRRVRRVKTTEQIMNVSLELIEQAFGPRFKFIYELLIALQAKSTRFSRTKGVSSTMKTDTTTINVRVIVLSRFEWWFWW